MIKRSFTLALALLIPEISSLRTSTDLLAASTLTLHPSTESQISGGDDVSRLKWLASGVGWDANPNAETTRRLKQVGIKSIRCINVDTVRGTFDKNGRFHLTNASRLDDALKTCRALGANPHVIIALMTLPLFTQASSRLTNQDASSAVQWTKYRAVTEAIFEHVLLRGFPHAHFEVGNEPDIAGGFASMSTKFARGSRDLYNQYLNLYTQTSLAARSFETEHPGAKVTLGGPALSWAYTYRHGDFNWIPRFLEDAKTQRLKLDFIGLHYYGNTSSLHGEYAAHYPPFSEMLETVQAARSRTFPQTPIWITEYGPSYHTENNEESWINASATGAAWDTEFLMTLLKNRIDGALYLVTTDLARKENGKWVNVWGWPSLFVNPLAYSKPYPKAPFGVFQIISRLKGRAILTEKSGDSGVSSFVSADPKSRKITVLLWNYHYEIPEFGAGRERGRAERVRVRLPDAGRFFHAKEAQLTRSLIGPASEDAFSLFRKGKKLDSRTELAAVKSNVKFTGDTLDAEVILPPSSVCLLEFAPVSESDRRKTAQIKTVKSKTVKPKMSTGPKGQ